MTTITYPLDETGIAPSNLITKEPHVLSEINDKVYRIIVPLFAPFYLDNLRVRFVENNGTTRELIQGVDYELVFKYLSGTYSIGKMLFGGIAVNTSLINGNLSIDYQTLGGNWTADQGYVLERIAELVYNPRLATWDQITDKQETYPPKSHNHDFDDYTTYKDLIDSINKITEVLLEKGTDGGLATILNDHINDPNHPYGLPGLLSAVEQESGELYDKLMTQRQISEMFMEMMTSEGGVLESQQQVINQLESKVETLLVEIEELRSHVEDEELHTPTKETVGLGKVENLPLATEEDITDRLAVDKYVTLAQVLSLLETHVGSGPGGSGTDVPASSAALLYLSGCKC